MPVIVFLLQSVNRCSRQQLRPQNCDSRFQSAVFKYAEFSSRSYAGCGGRTRRLLRVRCGSTETPKQAGSSESPVLKMLFIRAATHPYPIASVRTRSIGLYMLPNPNNSLIRFCKRRLSRHNRRWRFRARRVRCGSFFAELRALLFLR